jgi:xanthine dehydrogenase accessory factor
MNAAPTILADGDSGIITIRADEFVLEPMVSSPTVIIFGGGHISVSLAPLLSGVDFRVAVVDDRPEFISRDRFPDASHLVLSDFKNCFDQLEFTPETYAVIVTRGHLHDKTVLEEVLKRPTRYVGMIGSRRKREMIYQALREEGTSAESIERVRSPIGLEIGAETPEEIAISITAELIKTRAEGLRALKDWKV